MKKLKFVLVLAFMSLGLSVVGQGFFEVKDDGTLKMMPLELPKMIMQHEDNVVITPNRTVAIKTTYGVGSHTPLYSVGVLSISDIYGNVVYKKNVFNKVKLDFIGEEYKLYFYTLKLGDVIHKGTYPLNCMVCLD